MTRRRFLTLAGASAALALAGRGAWETYRFEVVRQRMTLSGLEAPLRLVWMCDLHYGPYIRAESVRAWVDAALAERPDLVVLGGDLVDSRAGDVEPLLAELARLRAPLGVFAVWGNHDHARFRRIARFESRLEALGIELLVNRGVRPRDDLHLAGVDDARRGRPSVERALRDRPAGVASLLATHNPDLLPRVPVDVGLTLAGHTHGGQIQLPFVGPVLTSSRYGRRFAEGWVAGPAQGYVSRGLGVGLVPIRFLCPAELNVFELVPDGL
jgi:uncharacterized protein